MKYKYIKLKIIIPTLILLMVAAIVIMFFASGLSADEFKYENITWDDSTGFLQPQSDGKSGWLFTTDSGTNPLKGKKYVGQSDNYALYINEESTVISVYKKLAEWNGPYEEISDKEELVCCTARPDEGSSAEAKSNLTVYYYDANGKENTAGLSVADKSVNYENRLKGTEKHYQIRYNENSVDICYQIGEFTNIYAVFPKYYNRYSYENIFVGNTYFKYFADDELRKNGLTDIYNEDGSEVVSQGYKLSPSYKIDTETGVNNLGFGICYDNEAALYILNNGLADSIEYYNNTNNETTKYVKEDNADEEILARDSRYGYWTINNIMNEDGTFRFKYGVNCNCKDSPVEINPFLTSSMIKDLFDTTYYQAQYDEGDPNKTDPTQSINDRNHIVAEDDNMTETVDGVEQSVTKGYMELKANNVLSSQRLYNLLVVSNRTYIDTDQELPSYLQDPTRPGKLYSFNGSHTYSESDSKQPTYYDYNGDKILSQNEAYVYGGYHYRDKLGNYLYIDNNNYVFYFDEEGKTMLLDDNDVPQPVNSTSVPGDNSYRPYQGGLTEEMAAEQNEIYDMTASSESIAFQVCLRFSISNDGLDVNVIHDSILEGMGTDTTADVESYFKHNCLISKIEVCKFMTVNNDPTSEGKIILPDGSGAIISFNTPKSKQSVAKYSSKRIYGEDTAINRDQMGYAQQKLMFPMYGFLENSLNRGIVAIIKKGGAQSSITANYMTEGNAQIDGYNYAYFTTNLRESEDVKITAYSNYLKISEKVYESDIEYIYHFLDKENLTYVDVAKDYREYLIKEYGLEEKADTTTKATPTIAFVGAYLKKTIALGLVYDAEKSLTTFKQASSIVNELNQKGLESMNIDYTLWTDDEGFDSITRDVDVSSILGGKSDLLDLVDDVKSLGLNMFLEYSVTNGYGYDLPFGALKYNAKSISGSRSNALKYVLSTGLADATGKVGGRMSPLYYNSLLLQYLKNYNELGINGIFITDLGNKNTSDYSKGNQVYSGDGVIYQMRTLETAKADGKTVMLNEPYDYTFKYVDVANNVPVETTLYPIVDNSIPLYQLVVSGLFDYTSKTINYNNDNSIEWNLLKAIETGSNLYFEVSAEDTSVLLDTNYTSYYNSYFANWKEKILYMNKVLDSTGIYESRLVNHEIITDTLVRVQYSNGLSILINYSNNNYYNAVDGISVRANWFAIEPSSEG